MGIGCGRMLIDRNINYTNVCNAKCTFCAFRRDSGASDAYTLEYGKILEKIGELQAIGGTQILMQGGMNPDLPLEWYLGLLRAIKEQYPRRSTCMGFRRRSSLSLCTFSNPPVRCWKRRSGG